MLSEAGREVKPDRKASSERIAIAYRPIGDLKLDPKNPRAHSRKQVRQIARSIEAFGFNVPVLIDKDAKVIAGHGRLLACRELGLEEIPTIALEHLSEAQARAFLIADNQLTLNASWDEQLLGEHLKALSEVELNFSLEVTGFEMGEIDLMIENLATTNATANDPADAIEPTTGKAVSRPGDLWILGPHRLYCGSALEAVAFQALMGRKKARMVFIDPPYNVPIDGHATGLGAIHHRDFAMASGEMSEAEFIAFLTQAFRLLVRQSHSRALHYVFIDWRHLSEILAAGRTVYSDLKNLCVWAKDNAGMGSFYRSQHELVFVFQNGSGPHRNNIELGKFGRSRSNIWNYPGANCFGRASEEGNLLALHPTVKPVALVADAVMDCSSRRDIVLDPFFGSRTTVIASERIGRICCGIELDAGYVDTAVRRWQKFTGFEAIHEQSGQTFSQREEEIR